MTPVGEGAFCSRKSCAMTVPSMDKAIDVRIQAKNVRSFAVVLLGSPRPDTKQCERCQYTEMISTFDMGYCQRDLSSPELSDGYEMALVGAFCAGTCVCHIRVVSF